MQQLVKQQRRKARCSTREKLIRHRSPARGGSRADVLSAKPVSGIATSMLQDLPAMQDVCYTCHNQGRGTILQQTYMARLARLGLQYRHGKGSSTALMSCHPAMDACALHGGRAAATHGRAYTPVLNWVPATWSARWMGWIGCIAPFGRL